MKFNNILFPTDFSERSHTLNQQVEWLAARFGSRVTLLHVFEIPAAWYGGSDASFIDMDCFSSLRDSARQRLDEYTLKIPEARVERVLREGNVAGEILNWINAHDIDLVVMGTHGYGAMQGWILGSVTAKVLHSAMCPVWTDSLLHDRPNDDPVISQILCAVEITDEGVSLLQFAKQLAEDLGATVQLIHSVPELETRPIRYFDFDLHRYLMESARVEIAKMQRAAGTEFPVTISGVTISSALAEAASEHRAHLVVIGRGKAQKALGRFQTHAYEIIRYAPCAVLRYSLSQQDRISSSCSAEHPSRFARDEQPLTGSLKP
jgi:nucleotide-binding universal stress UspA family protein